MDILDEQKGVVNRVSETEAANAASGVEWSGISISLKRLAHFADCVEEGRVGDVTCNLCDAEKMFAAIKTGLVGLEWIVEQFNEEMEGEAEHHRKQVEGFLLLKVETPKTSTESVADAYWMAMERLNAAGLDFGALVEYHHTKDDGEVDA
ncbi:MAG: hypothetical protein KY445_06325 [Armatimonadetes bacterium]|nr:hypothetical protein [Armatimonadota bacterium]